MKNNGQIARSSRGRTIIRTEAAMTEVASRRGRGAATAPRGGGRGVARAPRGGGRGAATAPRGGGGGRGAATAPRGGGRGATIAPRGGGQGAATAPRGGWVRRLEFLENDDAYEGDGDDSDEDEEEDGEQAQEEDGDEAQEEDGNEAQEENEDEADEDGDIDIWLRGPATLPPLPANEHEKWVIEPNGDNQWEELGGGKQRRSPSGVITVILKEYYPGLVEFNGRNVYPMTWKHFAAAPDTPDDDGVVYENCLERVEETFWKYFRWATDLEDNEATKRKKERDARRVLRNTVKRSITQLYYEACITAVFWYYAKVKKEKVTRVEAVKIKLTEAQYVEAIPSWMSTFPDCWITIVQQRWCNREWLAKSEDCKIRRSLMVEPAHHQGSSSLTRYKKIMEKKHKRPFTELAAYVAARTGSEEGAVCNDRAKQVLEKYSAAAKEKYGPDFEAINEPIDADIVYKVGCGKKHGRHLLADGYIDSRVSVSQSGSTSYATEDNIRPARRLKTPVDRIVDLESKVDNLDTKFDAMHELLLRISQNHIIQPTAAATPVGTTGTAGSIGNMAAANIVSPQPQQGLEERVEENNGDVVM